MLTVSPACVKCGICAEVCPIGIIGLDESGPKLNNPAACIRCGHCVASCPHPPSTIQRHRSPPRSPSAPSRPRCRHGRPIPAFAPFHTPLQA
jgi:ferredoxin